MHISAASRVGCVRHQNEDMILMGSSFIRNDGKETQLELTNSDRYLVAVADGMGGHNSGEVASSDTLHNLQFFFHDLPAYLKPGQFEELIVEWLDSVNNFIASKGRADEQYKGMGTTLVGLAFYEGEFYSLNCGDSRLYRFRDGKLTQLTTDHSLSNMLGSDKHSNIILNCIGGGCSSSYIDIVSMTSETMTGDRYLLCSDGLTDMVSDDKIAEMLANNAEANDLCEAAILAGGLDNVSCCVIEL